MSPKELSELTVFNRRKAHLLVQITRIRNSFENVDSPLNQVEIRTKLASLSEVKAKIEKLRTESYRVLSDEELMDFEASLDTMEVDADNLEVSLNTLLESSNVDTSELSVKNDFANYNVKLPSINLPEFSGQYINWLQFKSQFVSLTHDNACLSDSQKLYYLQSALKGHAKQLPTVNDSYSSLFEALEVRFNSGRYEVGFPWKGHTQELNDNFSVAEKRVKSLTRRFIRDPTLYIQYSEILKEYESQGIIERVLETEKPTDRAVFYLPHQAVFRQESLTTKMRIVFDASSHEDGQPSLNDCIWSELKIPRKILDSSGDSSEVQIHTFSDASQKAYGAAAFLRVNHKDRVSVDLVTSKSRVAPLKRLSLPRLELMGALLAARLAKEVKKILDQKCSTRAFFWTDSQVTLHWIKGPSHRWKPFVANRVREIQSLTDPNSWFHCSGKDNPADLLTRGISIDALTTNSKWWNGSSFLRQIDFQTKGLDEAIPERVYLTEMRKNSNQKRTFP
ncbi:integrase catalytic domain-containing protein [Trichonephila clavipes]|nr:integrase catalytic domain-containing protein [Trichonephila clavipes]